MLIWRVKTFSARLEYLCKANYTGDIGWFRLLYLQLLYLQSLYLART